MAFLKKHFYLFALLLLLTFGCRSCDTVESTKIAQSEIFQDYVVDASPGGTTATVTFRVGGGTGTTVDLDAPSKVEHNGRELTENLRSTLSGTYYSFSSDEFVGHHEFVYTNGEGRLFRNVIDLEPVQPLAVPPSIGNEKVVILLSRAIREDESLDTSITSETKPPGPDTNLNANRQGNIENSSSRYSVDLHQNYNSTRTAIEIDPGDLKSFVSGEATLQIKVSRHGEIQQKAPAGGAMRYTFTSGMYKVNVLAVSKKGSK